MSKSRVWESFTKMEDEKAKCNICDKILSVKGSSTSGLLRHFKLKHKNIRESAIDINIDDTSGDLTSLSTTANTHSALSPPVTKSRKVLKQMKLPAMVRPSLGETLARLAAVDNITLNCIATSQFIRDALRQQDFSCPQNPSAIRNIIESFYETVKEVIKKDIKEMKNGNSKFSITTDEFTSLRNRRYMNINVHYNMKEEDNSDHWNLGLVRVDGSLPADAAVELVLSRLREYGIESSDVLAATTDGAPVMSKFGRLIPFEHQLCLAHGIHLAVIDVIYKQNTASAIGGGSTDDDLSDQEYSEDEVNDPSEDILIPILHEDYCFIVNKVRKIVRMFRKSPTKNHILQGYVIEEKGKELNLILDCRTRWNSLEAMISRFLELRNSISKALIDIKDSQNLSDSEFEILSHLVGALAPIRMLSKVIGDRRTNIIQVDGALKFLFDRLRKNNTQISTALLSTLQERLGQRRNEKIVSLAKYLQNHDILYQEEEDEFFQMCSKKSLIETAQKLLKRLFLNETNSPQVEIATVPTLPIEDDLQSALRRAMNEMATQSKQSTHSKGYQFKSVHRILFVRENWKKDCAFGIFV